MGFVKYNRFIVFCTSFVLAAYGVYFYLTGYSLGWVFGLWGGICLLSLLLGKKNPHWSFLSLAATSTILFFVLRSYIPPMDTTPHFQVMVAILFVFLGCGIDGLYWVYKYERGAKYKRGYDE